MIIRNNGRWTESRFNSFIKSALRSASRKWPVRYDCINEAYVGTKKNKKTGRQAKHYVCAHCNKHFPSSGIQVDHIEPIINPTIGFVSWDDVIERMFCEKDGLQCLCKDCHQIKTNIEKKLAKEKRIG